MKRTGLVSDEVFLEHVTPDFHPEHPDRLRAIHAMLAEEGLAEACVFVEPREASKEEIRWIHTEAYFERIEATRGCSGLQLDPDTHLSSESHRVARLAAGGLCALVDAVCTGTVDNGFALVRPPGHHAEANSGMGFCVYNNVAIAARYAQERGLARKVLIADWDLHHGNGTQHAFESDPRVLYFSTHQFPHYPGTGRVEEVGTGPGEGTTVNVPLPGGQGDADFAGIYRELLVPIATQFEPDLLLVSAGFDIHVHDPLGGMRVTEEGFAELARILLEIAERLCGGRLAITLEGGYHLEGLAKSVGRVIRCLRGEEGAAALEGDLSEASRRRMEEVRKVQSPYWKL